MDFGGKRKGPISDINITPFVDIVLVLLITFMIAVPIFYSHMELRLPKTKKVKNLTLTSQQVVLSLTRTGEFYIGKNKFLETEIIPVIQKEMQVGKTDVLYLQADYSLTYGRIAQLLTFLKLQGITNIALVTDVERKTGE